MPSVTIEPRVMWEYVGYTTCILSSKHTSLDLLSLCYLDYTSDKLTLVPSLVPNHEAIESLALFLT